MSAACRSIPRRRPARASTAGRRVTSAARAAKRNLIWTLAGMSVRDSGLGTRDSKNAGPNPNPESRIPNPGRLHQVDLPHASRDRPRCTGFVPDLRHGARADDRYGGGARERRAPRHDAAVLDERCARGSDIDRSAWPTSFPAGRSVACSRPRSRHGRSSLLATPVVLWGGWPFFVRGWQSIVNRSLNMFTLIGLGVGVAYDI